MFDLDVAQKVAVQAVHVEAVKTQNSEAVTGLKSKLGPEGFAESHNLLERVVTAHTADQAEHDEFVAAYDQTLFVGGSKTKLIFSKILAAAAQALEGTGKVLQSEGQEKIDEKTLAQREFPNSPEMH